MKRIAYGETVVETDPGLADLILRYATLLAGNGAADTITFPGIVDGGPIEPISMVIGPASQMTAWDVEGELGVDVAEAEADLGRRIRGLSAAIPTSSASTGGHAQEFEELEGPTGA